MEISHVVGTEVVVVPILVVLDHLVNQGPPTPGKVDPGGLFCALAACRPDVTDTQDPPQTA